MEGSKTLGAAEVVASILAKAEGRYTQSTSYISSEKGASLERTYAIKKHLLEDLMRKQVVDVYELA